MPKGRAFSAKEYQEWVQRWGEDRHIPLARYGAFRVDEVWWRHPDAGERKRAGLHVVFEIDARYELDWGGCSGPAIPTRVELLPLLRRSWEFHRPRPGKGIIGLACYRRRVGPGDGVHEMTPGPWHVGPRFRRPSDPMIEMPELAPYMEAALRDLEQAAEAEARDGKA